MYSNVSGIQIPHRTFLFVLATLPDPRSREPGGDQEGAASRKVFGEEDIMEAYFKVWRETVFYAVAFLIVGIILGKLGF